MWPQIRRRQDRALEVEDATAQAVRRGAVVAPHITTASPRVPASTC